MAKKRIWERMEGEGFKAYSLLIDYLSLGKERSSAAVANRNGRPLALVQKLMSKFFWVKRSRAYDDYLLEVQKKAIEKDAGKDALIWHDRKNKYRHKEYTLAEACIAKAEEMLAAPLYETVEYRLLMVDGEPVSIPIIIKPVKWNFKDASTLVDIGTKLFRLSLEMETSRKNVNVTMDDPEANLRRAKGVLANLREADKVEAAVIDIMSRNASLDKETATLAYLNQLPAWVASDWHIDLALLEADDEYIDQTSTNVS